MPCYNVKTTDGYAFRMNAIEPPSQETIDALGEGFKRAYEHLAQEQGEQASVLPSEPPPDQP